ncbi:MAG: hypothetical protein HLUCCA12_02560 [Rhodobacteraceae bacterium HLUCCA12]|nr:MAG: hypothetical protein HLUCCA12_02560 [Rhodobacteraceae bacterium HLUCCA12]
MQPELTSEFWVQAYLTRLRLAAIPAYVLARGDATAGSVMVKLATLDAQAVLYQRVFDLAQDRRRWHTLAQGAEPEVDAQIARERARDPDLWVIEIEDRQGRHLLDEPGLDA